MSPPRAPPLDLGARGALRREAREAATTPGACRVACRVHARFDAARAAPGLAHSERVVMRKHRSKTGGDLHPGYVRSVRLERQIIPTLDVYPFSIPAVRELHELELNPKVTFLVGDNGTGKSTLLEAIAVAAGFNAEGGSKNFSFATRSSESELHRYLRLVRSPRRPRDGFFLRAESYFNVATEIERLDAAPSFGPPLIEAYGGVSLHEQSHGESFLALVRDRFRGDGFYILDEPEAALSPTRQLSMLALMFDLVERRRSQLVVATHSPILMAYPDATLFQLDAARGPRTVTYEQTDHYRITKDFLDNRARYFKHLFAGHDAD